MARLFTAGAELGIPQSEGLIANNTPTADTAVKRTGIASWKAAATNTYVRRDIAGVLARTYFVRGYYYFTNNPTGLHRMFQLSTATGTIIFQLEMVNTTRVLRLLDGSAAILATGTTPLTAATFHRLEISFNIASSGPSSIEIKINGVTEISGSFTVGNTAPVRVSWGITGGNIGGITAVHYDDLAINDDQSADQNSWPGEGGVYILLPVADPGTGTNQANWTKPGGTNTNRHTSIDNQPPIFIADSTLVADAEKILRNAINAASQLEIDLQDYDTAGVPSSDVIKVVVPRCGIGSTSSTDTAGDFGILSNPVGSQKAMTTFDNGIASATVTTWPTFFADPIYDPTVVRGTRPRLRLSRAAANRTVMTNVLSLIVETAPPPVSTTYYGAFSLPISFNADTDGARKVFGELAFPITFFKDIQGQRKTFGQIAAPFVFSKDVRGQRTTFGQIALPIDISIVTSGIRVGQTFYGVVSFPITFGKDIRGQRRAFGQIALPLVFDKQVQAKRTTFGKIDLPIIFTKEAIGRKQVFGKLDMQTLFGKEIAGYRKTFGKFDLPIDFDSIIKSGPVDVHGQIKLDLILTMDTNGIIKIAGVVLNEASALYLGNQVILASYLGDKKVWPGGE